MPTNTVTYAIEIHECASGETLVTITRLMTDATGEARFSQEVVIPVASKRYSAQLQGLVADHIHAASVPAAIKEGVSHIRALRHAGLLG